MTRAGQRSWTQVSGILTDEESDNFRAALARRPLVKGLGALANFQAAIRRDDKSGIPRQWGSRQGDRVYRRPRRSHLPLRPTGAAALCRRTVPPHLPGSLDVESSSSLQLNPWIAFSVSSLVAKPEERACDGC